MKNIKLGEGGRGGRPHVTSCAGSMYKFQVHTLRSLSMQARFNVELEIVLPRDMTVQESHDLSLELQHKVRHIYI